MFNYQCTKPHHQQLTPYVHRFIQLQGSGRFSKSIYSRLNTSFFVDFDQATFYDGQPLQTGLFVGRERILQMSPVTCQFTTTDKFFISFTPYGLSVFTKFSMQELSHGVATGEDIFGNSFHQLYEQLQPLPFAERVSLFETFLLQRFTTPFPSHQVIFDLADSIKKEADKSPFQLLKELPLSVRQIERNFKRSVGISIGRFLRVARFEKAQQLIATYPSKRLTDIAHLAGYFDQSHFITDFKRFTGVSPKHFQVCSASPTKMSV